MESFFSRSDQKKYGIDKPMAVYFVYGPLNMSSKQFKDYIVPQLDKALEIKSSSFIVADGYGADVMTLEYLRGKTDNVKVYYMADKPLYSCGFSGISGFKNYIDRDETMTCHSIKDITWIPKKNPEPRLLRNIKRRRRMNHNLSINLNIG